MLYHMSYIPFFYFIFYFSFFYILLLLFFFFYKNASGGVRTHASLDSRSWDGPLRPLGHECFSILPISLSSWDVLLFLFAPTFYLLVKMHPVGFEPTHLSIAELKSAPLDHSGTNASCLYFSFFFPLLPQLDCLFILSFIYSLFFMFFPYFLLYSFLYIIYI